MVSVPETGLVHRSTPGLWQITRPFGMSKGASPTLLNQAGSCVGEGAHRHWCAPRSG
jgi:hypothetical protein